MQEQRIRVSFARVRSEVYETMETAGIVDRVGEDAFYLEVDDAVDDFLGDR